MKNGFAAVFWDMAKYGLFTVLVVCSVAIGAAIAVSGEQSNEIEKAYNESTNFSVGYGI